MFPNRRWGMSCQVSSEFQGTNGACLRKVQGVIKKSMEYPYTSEPKGLTWLTVRDLSWSYQNLLHPIQLKEEPAHESNMDQH